MPRRAAPDIGQATVLGGGIGEGKCIAVYDRIFPLARRWRLRTLMFCGSGDQKLTHV